MASILDLYIQLGFEPADAHWKVPDPATQASYIRHKFQRLEDSWLKQLRSHSMLLDLLQGVREFAKRSATAALKLEVQHATVKSTPTPQVLKITENFLELDEKGLRYWGNQIRTESLTHGPKWPHDKDLITELLAEIFSFVIRSSKKSRDGQAKESFQAKTNDLPVSPDSATADTEGRPTHFVDLENHEVTDEDEDAGFQDELETESPRTPLTFPSTEELTKELRAWRQAHDNAQVPGTVNLRPNRVYTKKVMCDEGLAEVVHFKTDDEFMGWVLNRKDGTKVFVKHRSGGHPPGSSRFYGWLGGNFGFAKEPIATTWAAPSSLASSRCSRNPDAPDDFRGEISSQSELTERNEELEVPKSQKRPHTAMSDGLPNGSAKIPKTSSEEKRRKSPSTWPQWLRYRPNNNLRRGAENILTNVFKVCHPPGDGCQQCLDARVECVTASGWKRCAYCTAHNTHTVDCSPIATQPISREKPSPRSLQYLQSDVVFKSPSSSVAAGTSTRSSSLTDPPPSLSPLTPSAPDISFNFFSSDPSLGAISKPASACDTVNSFFDTALWAWNITGSRTSTTVVAVKVSWTGAKWPLMVPWKDPEAFRRMSSTLQKAPASGDGDIEVEVTCIPQR